MLRSKILEHMVDKPYNRLELKTQPKNNVVGARGVGYRHVGIVPTSNERTQESYTSDDVLRRAELIKERLQAAITEWCDIVIDDNDNVTVNDQYLHPDLIKGDRYHKGSIRFRAADYDERGRVCGEFAMAVRSMVIGWLEQDMCLSEDVATKIFDETDKAVRIIARRALKKLSEVQEPVLPPDWEDTDPVGIQPVRS